MDFSKILGAGALGCGAWTAWCVYANRRFSYEEKRKLSKLMLLSGSTLLVGRK